MRCSTKVISAILGAMAFAIPAAAEQSVWHFDNLSSIGGLKPTVEGSPQIVDSPLGKALQFNGKDTRLFFSGRPLVGAKAFTLEAVIRPEGGDFQQRWMMIAEVDPVTGRDSNPPKTVTDPNPRHMYELRTKDGQWYPDAYIKSKTSDSLLIFPDKQYPINQWYVVAQTYDGKTFRSYVNGVLLGENEFANYVPQGEGHMSVGARLNKIDYFKGSIAEARFTDRALKPEELLKLPAH